MISVSEITNSNIADSSRITLGIAEIFKLYSRKQLSGEDVQSYANTVNKLSVNCSSADLAQTALPNQFVFGLSSKRMQSRLLETKDFKFDGALSTAMSMDLSEKETNTLNQNNQNSQAVDFVKTSKKKPQRGKNFQQARKFMAEIQM